jgi:hypothetical protein
VPAGAITADFANGSPNAVYSNLFAAGEQYTDMGRIGLPNSDQSFHIVVF